MNILRGITKRWFLNVFSVVFIFLLFFEMVFIIIISSTYLNTTTDYMLSRANITTQFFNKYSKTQSGEFYSSAIKLCEDFSEKEKMELQIVDTDGKIISSSQGFVSAEKVTSSDFYSAVWGKTELSISKNKETNEKVISISSPLKDSSGNIGLVARFVVSYNGISSVIGWFVLVSLAFCAVVLLLVFISGWYFLSSIVKPLSEITNVSKAISSGDLTARVKNKYDNEIGILSTSINEMAEELSQSEYMKNDFISSVSHEIRTPLTAIKGWSETMIGCDPSKEGDLIEKGLMVINSETDRLKKMVDELLDFSKIQNSRLNINKEPIDIGEVLIEAVVIMKERANSEGKVLEFTIANELPVILGDKNRLKQVFLNIIDNSLKHSEREKSVSVTADFNENIIIKIIDNGSGITQELLPKIKGKFVKGDTSKKGSGLGLAIANEIVLAHGGNIIIESEIDVGTVVTINLPTTVSET